MYSVHLICLKYIKKTYSQKKLQETMSGITKPHVSTSTSDDIATWCTQYPTDCNNIGLSHGQLRIISNIRKFQKRLAKKTDECDQLRRVVDKLKRV